jgi:large subunit ribosomal protein L20
MKLAKGYWGERKNVWRIAKNHIEKGLSHAFVGRRLKKRQYRSLWIIRINAAARLHGTNYSSLMHGLKANNILINRKVLADFAMNKPQVFEAIVKQAIK